jgi:hypothetical protein
LSESRDPACFRICVSGEHEAELHSSTQSYPYSSSNSNSGNEIRISAPAVVARSHQQFTLFECNPGPSEMVPDDAPALGTQLEPHFAPPHVRSTVGRYRPALTLYLPAEQLLQTLDAGAPEYVPTPQVAHAVAPAAAWCLPASQSVQTGSATTLHVPVKPLRVAESSDVKVTFRKPVSDV